MSDDETRDPICSINVFPRRQWDDDTVNRCRSLLREWIAPADEANISLMFAWITSQ